MISLPIKDDSVPALVGTSERMRSLISLVHRVAASDASVLVCGETGTGKELVAHALHRASPRANGPFVVCDLSAISPTLIESDLFGHRRGAFTSAEHERAGAFARAHGGTIFLDEVGELSPVCQPRLLRAIERGEVKQVGGESMRSVDVRIVAATHRDLGADVATGRFRSDLFHRLAVVCLEMPPLRERLEDLTMLVRHIVTDLAAAQGRKPPEISEAGMNCLRDYEWPGNVRELKNVLNRAMSLAPQAHVLDVSEIQAGPSLRPSGVFQTRSPVPERVDRAGVSATPFKEAKERIVDEWENDYLRDALGRAEGNLTLAAETAGIARAHLYRLMRKHGLSR